MKRAPTLIPLSREHHHALRFARRLEANASAGRQWLTAQRRPLQEGVQSFWSHALAPHFRAEEAWPWEALAPGWQARLCREHRAIAEAIESLPWDAPVELAGALRALAAQLTAHVRWEEQALFPELERLALAEDLLVPESSATGDVAELPMPPRQG